LKKASTRKPKPGPKITPKPTRKLEPESQEILEAPSKENKDPDFDPNVAEEPKAPVRRSRRGATKASSKAAGVNPFTPRVKVGETPRESVKQVDSMASNKRKAEVPVKTPNNSSRNRFSHSFIKSRNIGITLHFSGKLEARVRFYILL